LQNTVPRSARKIVHRASGSGSQKSNHAIVSPGGSARGCTESNTRLLTNPAVRCHEPEMNWNRD
jgi:hypothetical protein